MTDPADIARAALAAIGDGWYDDAACRGSTEIMFDAARVAEARGICKRCPVAFECSITADANGETHGVWAGRNMADPDERRNPGKDTAA